MPTPPQQPPAPSPAEPDRPGRPAAPRRDREEPACPLPDAAAMRLLRVPDPAPPYDTPNDIVYDTASGTVYDKPCGMLLQDPPYGTPPPCGALPAGEAPGGRPGGRGGAEPPDRRDGSQGGGGGGAPGRHTGTDSTAPGRHSDGDRAAPGGRHGSRGGDDSGPPDGGHGGHGGHGGKGEPHIPGWPGKFAQALAETLAGTRPQRQLVPWTTEQALTRIQRLGAQLSAGQQPRLRRLITCSPARDVLEMTMIVGFGPRIRAVAVRLERTDPVTAVPGRPARPGRWLCTVVEAA
jgi:hypothetical protein